MPAPGTQLYFIALIPPSSVYEEALRIKEYFKEKYHSKGALNSPPHITLHMPFEWKVKKEEKLLDALEEFSKGKKSFSVSLQNFSCFAPRVIYINLTPSLELNQLQADLHRFCKIELNLFNAQYRDLPFSPHLTVAFRDLRKEQFALAWQEFQHKSFSGEFEVNKITLLKHSGSYWQPFKDFHF
jgi:2'-5' RNA ligase